MQMLLRVILAVLLFAGPAFAVPDISSVGGVFTHGSTQTITGTGFGTKSPAAPTLWDNGEHSSSVSAIYDDYAPQSYATGSSADVIMQYHSDTFRGVSNPHSRGTRYLGGCPDYNPDRSVERTTNVGVHVKLDSVPSVVYMHYYEELDPNYPREGSSAFAYTSYLAPNHKEVDFSAGNNGTLYGGTRHHNVLATRGTYSSCPADLSAATLLIYSVNDASAQDARTYCHNNSAYCITATNLIGKWGAWEHIIDFDGPYTVKFNNSNVHYDGAINYNSGHTIDAITIGGYSCHQWPVTVLSSWSGPDGNGEYYSALASDTKLLFRGLTAVADQDMPKGTVGALTSGQWGYSGGFAYVKDNPSGYTYYATNSACGTAGGGYGHTGHNDAYRYYDDIYIDSTWSRVMLCNNATYSSASVCEPQPPTVWTGTGGTNITVKVNLGALTGSTAYLFVFDSTNTANSTGLEVTLSDGDDTTAPTLSGVSPSGAQSCTSDPRNVIEYLTTNEASTCRAHDTETAWANMTEMGTTGGTSHSRTVSRACGVAYSPNVICRDATGNESAMSEWAYQVGNISAKLRGGHITKAP